MASGKFIKKIQLKIEHATKTEKEKNVLTKKCINKKKQKNKYMERIYTHKKIQL